MDRPHFIGIGGAGMSGIAKILAQRGAAGGRQRRQGVRDRRGAARARAPPCTSGTPPSTWPTTPPAWSSPAPSARTTRSWPRPRELRHPRRAPLRRARLADGRPARRSRSPARTARPPPRRCWPCALAELGLDPSYAIGGDLDAPGSNALHGDGEIFVAEADESDRSFHKYAPEVAIVLNVELDHHANYASMDEIYESFETFAGRIVPGGTLVISADHAGRPRADLPGPDLPRCGS